MGIFLAPEGQQFALLRQDHAIGRLSGRIITDVVARYARPLEIAPKGGLSDPLTLSDTVSVRTWRYRAPVDLEAKLYLLMYSGDDQPIAVLSRQIASALCFLCGER